MRGIRHVQSDFSAFCFEYAFKHKQKGDCDEVQMSQIEYFINKIFSLDTNEV